MAEELFAEKEMAKIVDETIDLRSTFPPHGWRGMEFSCIRDIILLFVNKIMDNLILRVEIRYKERCIHYKELITKYVTLAETECLNIKDKNRPKTVVGKHFTLQTMDSKNQIKQIYSFDLEYWSLCTVPVIHLHTFLEKLTISGVRTFARMTTKTENKGKQIDNEYMLSQILSALLKCFKYISEAEKQTQKVIGHVQISFKEPTQRVVVKEEILIKRNSPIYKDETS